MWHWTVKTKGMKKSCKMHFTRYSNLNTADIQTLSQDTLCLYCQSYSVLNTFHSHPGHSHVPQETMLKFPVRSEPFGWKISTLLTSGAFNEVTWLGSAYARVECLMRWNHFDMPGVSLIFPQTVREGLLLTCVINNASVMCADISPPLVPCSVSEISFSSSFPSVTFF